MLNKDSVLLENIYTSKILLNEVSNKIIDSVKNAVSNRELSFNNIFGNKLRLIIDVSGTETYKDILQSIATIPNFDSFDPKNKEVIKKIKLDAKYGGGEKEQRINLGKAISSLKLPEETKKKYLNWFAAFTSNIPEMDSLKDYSIIISRSPIDVLRMSDTQDIKSCHGPSGNYFQCAVQEAKTGGAIAYLVRSHSLKSISENELQHDEIFEDQDRNIDGIIPISRLRIRRYYNEEDNTSLAIPETQIYGKRIPGFYDSVKNFLKDKQSNIDINDILKQFKRKELIRTGGTYKDTDDSKLFNTMFDVDIFPDISLHHEENDEASSNSEQLEIDLRDYKDAIMPLEHCLIGYDINDDDENGGYSAWGSIILKDIPLSDELHGLEINDYDNLKSIIRYKENSTYNHEKYIPSMFKENKSIFLKLKQFLSDFDDISNNFVSDYLCGINISEDGTTVNLNIGVGNDFSDYFHDDVDDFRSYCRTISELDRDYEKLRKSFIKAAYKNNFIKKSDNDLVNDDYIDQILNNLTNFEYDEDNDEITTTHILYKTSKPKRLQGNTEDNLDNNMCKFIENYIKIHFKPDINDTVR